MSLLLEDMGNNPAFIQELTELLQNQMGTILRTEDILTKSKNNSVNQIMETKKMHSLEKLSAMELQSIKEDLLRQRDLMSKRLYRRTQRNKVLEKEREQVYKSIQEEGKMLINKCNMLRKEGLLLMYKIGLAKKEAEELTAKMKKNFTDKKKFFKKDVPGEASGDYMNRKKLLPIQEYIKGSKAKGWGGREVKKPKPEESNAVDYHQVLERSNEYKFQVNKFYENVQAFIKSKEKRSNNLSRAHDEMTNNMEFLQVN